MASTLQKGREKLESCLLVLRLVMSFRAPPTFWPPSVSAPNWSSLDQVKLKLASSPRERRLVAVTCSESYQVLPSGPGAVMSPNCGKGRSDWSTEALVGKPA